MMSDAAVLVTGATGFVGSALVASLCGDGRSVIALSRDPRSARATLGDGIRIVARLDEISPDTAIDTIVHLAGARVLGMPWTASRRRVLLASRVDVTHRLIELMQRLRQTPRTLIAASAVGFYGAAPGKASEPCTESSLPTAGQFQSDLCATIETEACRAEGLAARVVRMRFAVVLGRGGGAYPMQALAARCGLGAVLGTGTQPAPWVHLDDAIGLLRFAMARTDVVGAVNAVAPDTPSQGDFARAMALSFGRRARLHVPAAPLRFALGEMGDLLLEGRVVLPAVALQAGYVFLHPSLGGALNDLARRGN